MVIDYMFFDAGFLQNDRQAGNPSVGRGKTAAKDRENHPLPVPHEYWLPFSRPVT